LIHESRQGSGPATAVARILVAVGGALLALALLLSPTQALAQASVAVSSPVYDPKIAGASLDVASLVSVASAYYSTVAVTDDAGRTVRTLVASAARQTGRTYRDAWNGLDDRGLFVPPGRYRVRLRAQTAGGTYAREAVVNVVRLGLISVQFGDGAAGARVPLAYHRADPSVSGSVFPVDAAGPAWTLPSSDLGIAGCVDRGDGSPLAIPAVWTNLASPPRTGSGGVAQRGRSLPVAYVQGSRARVVVALGSEAAHGGRAVGCGYPVQGLPIRLVLGQAASAEIRPGGQVALDLPALPAGVQRLPFELPFRFQVFDGQSWRTLPGAIRTQHVAYIVLDRPSDGRPAWVAACDLVGRFNAGRGTDGPSVLNAIASGLNGGLGLTYDSFAGAPAYSNAPQSLAYPVVELGAFLDGLRFGRQVNCLDCAGATATLGRHVGARPEIAVIGWNFRLNWIRGIGRPGFSHDLFGGGHAFSFHAFATGDRAQTVLDACLSVDDDASPWSSPFLERLPAGMPYSRYISKLTPDTHVTVKEFGRASYR